MPIDYPEHPFWDHSLRIYAAEDVSRACIDIQERYQMDVNLLLLGTWCGASGRGRLSPESLASLDALSRDWNRDIVCSLRAIRDRLKQGFDGIPKAHADDMRKSVLSLEIECEHIEHLAMAALLEERGSVAPGGDALTDAAENLLAYFQLKGVEPAAADLDDMAVILRAAFPDHAPTEIRGALSG